MDSENPPLTLTVPSDPRMLSVVRSFVEAVGQTSDFDKSGIFAVVMAVGEAFTNVVRHAHRDNPEAPLQIQCWIHDDAVEVRILDQGPPFDLANVPFLEPGEMRVGGRGVYMMRNLMDELATSARPGGGNVLRMVKYRQNAGGARNCG